MFSIASHIEYLLMTHQCVVAPGLGAFLVHESHAYYDEATSRFMPPTRSIGFNQAVTLNDGLLAESVARKDNISLEVARAKVEAAVTSFRNQLSRTSSLPVGNLGEMSLSDDGNIVFEPSADSAVTIGCRGLLPLSVRPLVSLQDDNSYDDSDRRRPAVLPLALKVAASLIIALLTCGLFLTTGRLVGDGRTDHASLDSGLSKSIVATIPAPAQMSEDLPMSREIQLNIALPAPESASRVTPIAIAADNDLPSVGRYLLVVGSYPTVSAARRQIGDDKSLQIIEMNGRYRIFAASAPTLGQARLLVDSISDYHPQVWICRR